MPINPKFYIPGVLLIFSLFLSCSDPASDDPEDKGNPDIGYPGYTLVWQDEFNGNGLNQTKWQYETGTGVNGDFGTGQLDRATDRTDNVSISKNIEGADGGALTITLRKEQYIDRNYTSGRINTNGKMSVGPGHRIEGRIWPRDVLYKGLGFAMWMMPAEIPEGYDHLMWPQGGEVDIMEYVGSIPNHNLGSVHYAWAWNNNQWASWNHGHKGGYYSYEADEAPVVNPGYGGTPNGEHTGSAGFRIYGLDWYEDRMEFYIDSTVYHIHYFNDGDAFDNGITDGEDEEEYFDIDGRRTLKSEYSHHFSEWEPFEHPFYLILSAGVGGEDNRTYGGAIVQHAEFPSSIFIDWIRVYERDE